ncbi:hypothetical protein [Ornithinibacillus bavariensis]|uniref:hypothetical protein n=1 Tax=Ornithinibacillus bavariensis TaxID=545502 RepID=UPI000EF0396D|nr:hypothetical protein [Ornithinibacillus sp.]
MVNHEYLWQLLQEVLYKELVHAKENNQDYSELEFLILTMLVDYKVNAISNKSSDNDRSPNQSFEIINRELDKAIAYHREKFEGIMQLL